MVAKFVRLLPRFRHAARAIEALEQREAWTRAQIEAWHVEKLNELWSHAVAHVPCYSRLAREHALPTKFASVAEFSNTVPLLPRLAVWDDPKDFLSARAQRGFWKCTSGSSGKPLLAYWSRDAHQESLYAKYRFQSEWGVNTFDRTVFLWSSGASHAPGLIGALSRARQPILDRLRNRLRLSATTMTTPGLREYLAKMKTFAPTMLYGYSRALYLFALEAEASGYDCESLKLIVATSEPAWPHMIDRMERAFHAPVAREYGAVECGIMATDTPRDRMLRVREDQILMETLPRDDGFYDIVVTVLNNPSFPLIRYAIGDVTDQPLRRPEGGGFAVLSGVAGRDNDLLRRRSGGYFNWVDIEFAMEELGGEFVRRYAVYQCRDGSVNVQVEPNPAVDMRIGQAAIPRLQGFLQERLEGYPVTIRLVDSVEQTRAGKHRLIQSELFDLNTAAQRSEPPSVGVGEALTMSTTTLSQTNRGLETLPLVCAYVITYDGKRFLERCFRTLQERTDYENCRLFLADNGSSDGSSDYVRENFPEVEVLRIFPNAGYAHGANEAVKHAKSQGAKYVVLMNDDIEILHEHWLSAAITHAERDPSIGIIGFSEPETNNQAQAVPELTLTDVVFFGGFAMVIPVEVFDRIGLFDEVYFVVGDEDDLAARALAAGYRVAVLGIPIYHLGGGTTPHYSLRTAYLQMRNGIRFCLKNRHPVRALIRAARIVDIACNPWSLSFDKSDAAHRKMRNKGNVFANASIWVQAVAWNVFKIPQTLRIRVAERRLIDATLASRKDHKII